MVEQPGIMQPFCDARQETGRNRVVHRPGFLGRTACAEGSGVGNTWRPDQPNALHKLDASEMCLNCLVRHALSNHDVSCNRPVPVRTAPTCAGRVLRQYQERAADLPCTSLDL